MMRRARILASWSMPWAIALATALVPAVANSAGVDPPASNGAPTLASRVYPGAIEIGIASSIVSIAGSTDAAVTLRTGTFVRGGPGLAGAEIAFSYDHVSALDLVDAELALSWQPRLDGTTAFPFVSIHGGIREEWIGSFSQSHVPLGASLGVRMLFGSRAGIRAEYSFRRLLHDPIADFNEHRVLIGLSLFFRNRADR